MTEILFTHASLDTFNSDAANREDVAHLTEQLTSGDDRLWITLTETAEPETVAMIRRIANRRYVTLNPDAGDVTFLVHRDLEVIAAGGPVVIPAVHKPARLGGHGPRCNSWVTMRRGRYELSHVGLHLVTARTMTERGAALRLGEQRKQLEHAGELMDRLGRGDRIATGSGDLNGVLPRRKDLQQVMDAHELTTTASETRTTDKTTATARIDYVWTRDADPRLSVQRMKVRHGAGWHSDHDPIDVWAHLA
jgi:endonuclease/exonuclease/phosphatase (EEP) superfamily protein YafD